MLIEPGPGGWELSKQKQKKQEAPRGERTPRAREARSASQWDDNCAMADSVAAVLVAEEPRELTGTSTTASRLDLSGSGNVGRADKKRITKTRRGSYKEETISPKPARVEERSEV